MRGEIQERKTKEKELQERKIKEKEIEERKTKEKEIEERKTKEKEIQERKAKEGIIQVRRILNKISGIKPKNLTKTGIVTTVLQLLFPRRCPACDGIVQPIGEKLCTQCLGRLKLLTPPWCMKCGKKITGQKEYCADCVRKEHEYIRGRALYEYESAALSIYRFKYGGRQEYASFYGEQVSEYLGDFVRSIRPDALIPIPLHKKRKRARGYNQAELLAQAIGEGLGVPVYTDFLVRKKNTAPLKYENPKERQNNLKKAFNIRQNDVKLEKVILIDDIYTTGSTIDEAARTLKTAGVKEIYFIALACGAGFV